TTTASLEVPVAARPSSQRTPAARRTSVLTSVSVATRFTSAAGSGSASTTAIVLIVAGNHAARALSPAALGFERPTVATTRARTSSAAAVAISALSVDAPVSRPTHGAGTPR